jgi:hypothetical protein
MSKPSGYRRLQVPLVANSSFNSMKHQYDKTNVMHFLFSLLRIKGLYMFRALLAHPQEALHNGTWYIAFVLCQLAATKVGVERNIPSVVCGAPPEDEQVILETCRGP